MEIWKGADHLTDANEEKRREGWRHQEVIQWGHQMVLNL